MQCKPVSELPLGEKWTYEIKFDGYRFRLPPSQFRHAQLAHEGRFLGLMPLHTSKHVAKKIERPQNMRTFIEHYAFRSSGHCRISHFGSRR